MENEETRTEEGNTQDTQEKVIRVDSLEAFDWELARDGGETLEVPAWIAEQYGIFPEEVGTEDDFRDDGQGPVTETSKGSF